MFYSYIFCFFFELPRGNYTIRFEWRTFVKKIYSQPSRRSPFFFLHKSVLNDCVVKSLRCVMQNTRETNRIKPENRPVNYKTFKKSARISSNIFFFFFYNSTFFIEWKYNKNISFEYTNLQYTYNMCTRHVCERNRFLLLKAGFFFGRGEVRKSVQFLNAYSCVQTCQIKVITVIIIDVL